MTGMFRASLYTPLDIADSHIARTLWQVIDNPLIAPRRFDSDERAKIEFDPQRFKVASDIYSAEGVLLTWGANTQFEAMFSQLTDSLAKWTFWWELDAMGGPSGESWLQWLYGLCKELPPYYGFACSVDEYEAKHKMITLGQPGSAARMVGVSGSDFSKFLPGVYWLTIFGPELAGHFDTELKSLPDARCVSITPSHVAVLLDSPVRPESMDARLRAEGCAAGKLGAEYFFDRTDINAARKSVPSLARALREASA